jgi:hypothetical protein
MSHLKPGAATRCQRCGHAPAHLARTWRQPLRIVFGYRQRARDRRGGGRADPRQGDEGGRSLALRSSAPCSY